MKKLRSHHSESTKRKMSLAKLGKPKSAVHRLNISRAMKRPVVCNETGKIYDSLTEAANALEVTKGSIWSVLAGNLKYVKGFTFSYMENNNE